MPQITTPPITYLYKLLKDNTTLLDLGCIGFHHYKKTKELGFKNIKHFGVDYTDPSSEVPSDFTFIDADLNKEPIPFEDDKFDYVIAKHIIEHLNNPIEFVSESLRVCKPGGYLYIEAPSERSLLLPGMPFKYENFRSSSFFDDPTHVFRPWSAQGFYRLAKYFNCEPIKTGYATSWVIRILFPFLLIYSLITKNDKIYEGIMWSAFGWASYIIIQKPNNLKGKPVFKYYYPQSRL